MADVFISYSSNDRERASQIASLITAAGIPLWWDRKLVGGEMFRESIDKQLALARCVVVLWSRQSVQSSFVRAEAAKGFQRGLLVPVWIDGPVVPVNELPVPFNELHTIMLSTSGSDATSESEALLTAIRTLLGSPKSGARKPVVKGAPAPPLYFVGREKELHELDRALLGDPSEPAVVSLLGMGGQGKSALAYAWLNRYLARSDQHFDNIGYFSAYRYGGTFQGFLQSVHEVFAHAAPSAKRTEQLAPGVAQLIRDQKSLVVIDGLERWLRGWQDSDELENVTLAHDRDESRTSRGLDDYLHDCAGLTNGSRVLFTSRALPKALDAKRVTHLGANRVNDPNSTLSGLATQEGIELLERMGVAGDKKTLGEVVDSYRGHPLALTVWAKSRLDPPTEGVMATPVDLVKELRTGTGTGRDQALDLEDFDEKLKRLFEELKQSRPKDVPLIRIASACFGDAPIDVVAKNAGPESVASDVLRARLSSLADWGIADLYNGPVGGGRSSLWIGLHPLVKKHFRPLPKENDFGPLHQFLGHYFGALEVAPAARTLADLQPRLWAVRHMISAKEFDRACGLLFESVTPDRNLAEWFVDWGYIDYEIDIEESLLEKVETNASKRKLLLSLQQNHRNKGDLDKAITYMKQLRDLPDE